MINRKNIILQGITLAMSGAIVMEGVTMPFNFVSTGSVAENQPARINIYDRIGESFWEEGITGKSFVSQLSAIDDKSELDVYISTNGGNTMDGTVMYNALINRKGKTNTIIDGYAISMGSILAMAGGNSGGKTRIAKNGMIMIHKPMMQWVSGNADDFRKMAEDLDLTEKALISPYTQKTGKSEKEISDMLTAVTWMDAEEALKHGFVDEIVEATKVEACLDLSKVNTSGAYGTVPEAFLKRFAVDVDAKAAQDALDAKAAQDALDAKAAQDALDAKAAQDALDAKAAQDALDDQDKDPVVMERKRCAEIQEMCLSMGFPNRVKDFIAKGTSVVDAQSFIMDLKNAVEEEIDNKSNLEGKGDDDVKSGGWADAYKGVPGLKSKTLR